MSAALTEIREFLLERLREYLSVEQNRRDARSAGAAFVTFFVILFMASHGMMPNYLMIDRPGRAITVKFVKAPELTVAEIAQTRVHDAKPAPQMMPAPPRKTEQPRRIESISSLAASRPDYAGKHAILPPVPKDRPTVSDAPARWNEKPAPNQTPSERPTLGSASVAMPSARIGTVTGSTESTSEISFDVQVSGGSKGADFITLSGKALPSSVGRAVGKEMSVRRPVLRQPLPRIPEWFERKGIDSFVTLRIVISAAGKVESAEVEKTSGFKELDAEARDAILQWVFEASGFRESISVKLNFRLR